MNDFEPVRWAFLGAGRHATLRTAPALHATREGRLYAAAARDQDRASALGPAVALASYDAVVTHRAVEAVYICLANDQHVRWAFEAIENGKHVLCEKPLTRSVAELDRLVEAADRRGVLLAEASWYRWHPRIRLVQRLVAGGELGRVTRVESRFHLPSLELGGYRTDPRAGGGVLLDLGPYVASSILWAFGWAPVESVQATVRTTAAGLDTSVDGTLDLAGGVAEFGMASGPRLERFSIRGTDAALALPGSAFAAAPGEQTEIEITGPGGTSRRVGVASANAYQTMFAACSARIRGVEAYLPPLAQTRATIDLLDRIRAAAAPARL